MNLGALSGPRTADVAAVATSVTSDWGLATEVVDGRSATVRGVVLDSRAVAAGSWFCCIRGEHRDGHEFAVGAVAAGASALLVDHPLPLDVAQVVVADTRVATAPVAAEFYGNPSRELEVIGVTGTNGKTTVVTILGQVLDRLGTRVRVIGTLTGTRTTPEAPELQAILREAVAEGCGAVAMEVSSHALELHRVDATRFAAAIFTNLGADHLDFHGTPERYFAAKARLFDGRSEVSVVNLDDVYGRLLRDSVGREGGVVGYRLDDAADLVSEPTGSRFTWRGHQVHLPLAGRHNVSNALAAATCLVELGHDPAAVAAALGDVAPPAGRFESVRAGQPFSVVVDYAHTPDALEVVLGEARRLAEREVRVVFGCGGDRDRSKRARMGAVACELADQVVITTDNPRSEDPEAIMATVARGCRGLTPVLEADRRAAIRTALGGARGGDVVVIAGKGHETTQVVGDRVQPFDDRLVALEELRSLGFDTGVEG